MAGKRVNLRDLPAPSLKPRRQLLQEAVSFYRNKEGMKGGRNEFTRRGFPTPFQSPGSAKLKPLAQVQKDVQTFYAPKKKVIRTSKGGY